MNRIVLLMGVLIALSTLSVAQDKGIPEDHKGEVLRRGDMVTMTGEFGSDEACEGYEALELPEDDSHKWYITVLSLHDCAPCVELKKALEAGKLEAWVQPTSPDKSWAHYTVRYYDDPLQKDWFKKLKDSDLKGFPKLLVQPPLNGDYGEPSTIVAMLQWDSKADPDMKKLSKKIRDSIVKYAASSKHKRRTESAYSRGAQQSTVPVPPHIASDVPVGKTPELPFKLDEYDSRKKPALPDEIPPNDRLSVKDMKDLAPDATPEFLLEQQASGETDPERFQLKWLVEKARKQRPKDVVPDDAAELILPGMEGPAKAIDKALSLLSDMWRMVRWMGYLIVAVAAGALYVLYMIWDRVQKTVTITDFNKWTEGMNSILAKK